MHKNEEITLTELWKKFKPENLWSSNLSLVSKAKPGISPALLVACFKSVEETLNLANALQQDHTLYFGCVLKWTVMTEGFSLRWHYKCHKNTTPVELWDVVCPTNLCAKYASMACTLVIY